VRTGISISDLFGKLGSGLNATDVEKNELWDSFVAREDVFLDNDKPLCKSLFKKLALEDVFDDLSTGLHQRKVRVKGQEHGLQSTSNGTEFESISGNELGGDTISQGLKPPITSPTPPVRKRRGRPPKRRIEDGSSAIIPEQNSVAKHPRKRRQPSPTVESPVTPAPDASSNATPSLLAAPEPQSESSFDGSFSAQSTLRPTPQVSTTTTLQKSPNVMPQPPSDPSATPSMPIRQISFSSRNLSKTAPPLSTPKRAYTRRTPINTPVQSHTLGLREATFTSYDDLQREAGVARVYIDPSESETPVGSGHKRRPQSIIAIFKSDKLKDPEWLTNRRDSWVDIFAKRVAGAVIHVKENTQVQKRQYRRKDQKDQDTEGREESIPSNQGSENPAEGSINKKRRTSPKRDGIDRRIRGDGETHNEGISIESTASQVATNGSLEQQMSIPETVVPSSARQTTTHSGLRSETKPNGLDPGVSAITYSKDSQIKSAQPPSDPAVRPEYMLNALHTALSQAFTISPNYFPSAHTQAVTTSSSPRQHISRETNQTYHTSPQISLPIPAPTQTSLFNVPASNTASIPANVPIQHSPNISMLAGIPGQGSYRSPYALSQVPSTGVQGPSKGSLPSSDSTLPAAPLLRDSPFGPKKGLFQPHPKLSDPQLQAVLFTPKPASTLRKTSSIPPQAAVSGTHKRQISEANDADPVPSTAQPPKRRRTKEHPLQPKAKQEQMLELKRRVRKAEAVEYPESLTRFPCVYHESAGNLILSVDKSVLEFFSLSQNPSELPLITLDVSQIVQHPIMSARGSFPMELRVNAEDDNGFNTTYKFSFVSSPSANSAASHIRAAIVTAMIASDLRRGKAYERPSDVKLEILKPFKCDTCSSRFKNPGGLEYHVTKSNTTCNPNFDPSTYVRKYKGGGRKRTSVPKPLPQSSKSTPKKRAAAADDSYAKENTPAIEDISEDDEEYGSDSSTSSEDSIIEWWQQHSTNGFGRTYTAPGLAGSTSKRTVRRYCNLKGESALLEDLTKDTVIQPTKTHSLPDAIVARPELDMRMTNIPTESLNASPALSNDVAADKSSTSKELDVKAILLSLVKSNSGLFPDDRGLWFALVGVWLKDFSGSGILPESKLCRKALDELLENKNLERIEFSFWDGNNHRVTRKIVTTPGFDLNSPRLEMLKELIKESHPAFYVPSTFAPPDPVLARLQTLARPDFAESTRIANDSDDGPYLSQGRREPTSRYPILSESESSDEDDFSAVGDDETGSEASGAEEDIESDEDEDGTEDVVPDGGNTFVARQRARLKAQWAIAKAEGRNTLSRSGTQRKGKDATNPRKSKRQKESRAARAAETGLKQRSWSNYTPSFMPNPQTGAWDQPLAKPPKPTVRGARYYRKRIPEPITYFQDPSGAWSIRAFGHGVKPVFSRPSKRVSGNPNYENYRRRLESGFRPVLYPSRNRKYGPEMPSKAMMRGLQSGRIDPASLTPDTLVNPLRDRPIYSVGKRRTRSFYLNDEYDKSNLTDLDQGTGQRISKVTGRPVRPYNKRFPKDVSKDPTSSGTSRYHTRATSKAAVGLDEAPNLYEPKKLHQNAGRNPGLETLPPNFGLGRSQNMNKDVDYPTKCNVILFMDPKNIHDVSDPDPGLGSWTSENMTICESESFKLRWDDQTVFTSETLPYKELDDDSSDEDGPSVEDYIAPRPTKRSRKVYVHRDPKVNKYEMARQVTALTTDFHGAFVDPMKATSVFNIEVAKPNKMTRRRGRIVTDEMPPATELRFIVTVVVIRTLVGGLDQVVDWVLVASLFKDYTVYFLSRLWIKIQESKEASIDQLAEDFQNIFLAAYEKGDISPINYDNVLGYDWNALIDWAMRNLNTSFNVKGIRLPDCRKELKRMHSITKPDKEKKDWTEVFFDIGASRGKRFELAAAAASTRPVHSEASDEEAHELTIAKSWVRATALTPEEDWDPKIAGAKLAELGLPLVEQALELLTDSRVIMHRAKHRATPGRSYEATDFFSTTLRKHVKETAFLEAVAFKKLLDETFLNGSGEGVKADYMADEGTLMCITQLQAHGRVKLIPVGVPMNKFGLMGGGYEPRKLSKGKLRFEMFVHPTDSYIFDIDNDVLRGFFDRVPPRGDSGAIPVWYGVSEMVIKDIWKKILVAVSQIVALRTGVTVNGLAKIFKPVLEEWETKLLLEWGAEVGLFERLHGEVDGWTVKEWWWLTVGRSCESH
jgi:hypothetical protein